MHSYAKGGRVESPRDADELAAEQDRDHAEQVREHEAGDIRPMRQLREDPLAEEEVHREHADASWVRPSNYSKGGDVVRKRKDGSGIADGIHHRAEDCEHLANGELCRHSRTNRDDMSDEHVRNFAGGGEVGGGAFGDDSFEASLSKRKKRRGRFAFGRNASPSDNKGDE
jgi:hypothetical protein